MTLWLLLAACSSSPTPTAAPTPEAIAIQAVAEASGRGFVVCDLSGQSDATEVVRVPYQYATRDGARLWFTTPDAEGAIRLLAPPPAAPGRGADDETMRAYLAERQAADKPWAVARWTGASEGQAGTCEVADPAEVRVPGRVEGAEHGVVHGCGGAFRVTAGAFEVVTTDGEPCQLRHDRAHDGLAVWLTREPVPDHITVPAAGDERSAAERIGDQAAAAADEVAKLKARVDVLQRAFAATDASDASAVIAQWSQRAELELATAQKTYDNVQRFREALEKAHETYGQVPNKP